MAAENFQILPVPFENGHATANQNSESVFSPAKIDVITETQQRLRLLELCIEVLISQTKIGKLWVEGYQETLNFLETLPLSTNDFNLAKLRLVNALVYCRQNEFGAAAFELRALRGRVQKL